MLLGRRRLRDLGPLEWLALAVGVLAVGMNLVALFGWRLSFEARNPGPATEAATAGTMLLVSLSVACGALSLLLGPR